MGWAFTLNDVTILSTFHHDLDALVICKNDFGLAGVGAHAPLKELAKEQNIRYKNQSAVAVRRLGGGLFWISKGES